MHVLHNERCFLQNIVTPFIFWSVKLVTSDADNSRSTAFIREISSAILNNTPGSTNTNSKSLSVSEKLLKGKGNE